MPRDIAQNRRFAAGGGGQAGKPKRKAAGISWLAPACVQLRRRLYGKSRAEAIAALRRGSALWYNSRALNLHSISEIREWCISNGFHPNRTLGQNFLADANTLAGIVRDAGVKPGERILEIGPGLGSLTSALLEAGASVFAVEKDRFLAESLPARFPGAPLETVCADALRMAEEGKLDGFGKCVSNLPYSSGTRILLELAARPQPPQEFTVLVQTEVAERLAAGPGSKTRGFAGVRLQLDYGVSIVREVAATCFWPKPAVGSSVAKIVRKAAPPALDGEERDTYFKIAKTAFSHRRKQMRTIFKGFTESSARPEDLSVEDWMDLARKIARERIAAGKEDCK